VRAGALEYDRLAAADGSGDLRKGFLDIVPNAAMIA
jgi:hypothetical protein